MEQLTRDRTEQRQEQVRRPAEQSRAPERLRLSDAGLTARLALEGVPLLDLPPRRLEELAGWIGNSGMLDLLDARIPPVEEADFRMPAGEPETVPFQVEGGLPVALARPEGLTEAANAGAAFHPAVFTG